MSNKKFSFKSLLNIKNYNGPNMVLSFIMLRFLATCLITNTHYNYVYPIKALAVGGLLGDVLFFIVSGFVLSKPTNQSFLSWYLKRIIRIYPAIIFGVILYEFCGTMSIAGYGGLFNAFVFPTFFVFTAAIIILYIPFFFVNKINDKNKYFCVIFATVILWILMYIFYLDKTTYQMNNTSNLMIAFPYFFAMIFGGGLHKFYKNDKSKIKTIFVFVLTFVFLAVYFIANNKIRGNRDLFNIQIFVPVTLLIGVCLLSLGFYRIDDVFKKIPPCILKAINFISGLTLEIYVVQKPIIYALQEIVFPINWIIITASIVAAAVVLRIFINLIITAIETFVLKIKTKEIL